MKKMKLLVISLLLLAAYACKKHPFDYRNKFLGDYLMQVRLSSFNMAIPGSNWDSVYMYVGELRYGDSNDEVLIVYGNLLSVQLKVTKTGDFSNLPTHYGGGSIINNDSISLYMRWGGLGGGISHAVNGRRIGS